MPQKVKIYVSRFAFSERAKKLEEKSKKITAIKPIIAKNLLGVWVTAPKQLPQTPLHAGV